MSEENTPTAEEATPSWFPLPRFTPNTDVLLHAAEIRIAIAEKNSKQSACKRTPNGALKKGEEVAYNDAQAKFNEVLRKHAPIVLVAMDSERKNYVKRAKRAVFEEFVRNAAHVLNSPSGLAEAMSPHESIAHNSFNENGDPVIRIKSHRGNTFTFWFSIDDTLITRVEVYQGDTNHFTNSIATINHHQWSRDDKKTLIGSCHINRTSNADDVIEEVWVIEAAAQLCKDVAEHNKRYTYGDWQTFTNHISKAEKDAFGLTHHQCPIPEPIKETESQANTPTA